MTHPPSAPLLRSPHRRELTAFTQTRQPTRDGSDIASFRQVFALLSFVFFGEPEVARSHFLFWRCLDVAHERVRSSRADSSTDSFLPGFASDPYRSGTICLHSVFSIPK